VNYFFLETLDEGEKIERIIDDNLKTDYGRIKMLLNKPENIEKLENIIEFGKIQSKVIPRFSIERIHDLENFLSLLYYMGLLTIEKDNESNNPLLRIPNYSIKTMYWEYVRDILKNQIPELSHNEINYYASLKDLAIYEKPEEFIKFIHQFYVSRFSNRDFQRFDEKYIKAIILTLMFQGGYYLPISELENSGGYSDIYFQRRNLYPLVKTDWVWEIKYVKEEDAGKKSLIAEKKNEAITQLQRYKNSNLFKGRNDVRYLAVVFIGKKKYWTEELSSSK
jgi:hypothetical protein